MPKMRLECGWGGERKEEKIKCQLTMLTMEVAMVHHDLAIRRSNEEGEGNVHFLHTILLDASAIFILFFVFLS